MSIMDELKKLTRPYDDDDTEMMDDDMDLDVAMDDEPVYTRPAGPAAQTTIPEPEPQPQSAVNYGAASTVRTNVGAGSMNMGMGMAMGGIATDIAKYRVVLVQPEKFDVVTSIADNLRNGDAVILNCEKTDKAVARRVVDFLSGCAYALDGSLKKAAANVYILVPRDVGVDETKSEVEDEEA